MIHTSGKGRTGQSLLSSKKAVWLIVASAALLVAACTSRNPEQNVARFAKGTYPALLSEWQLLKRANNRLTRAADTEIYQINTPLFSDYTLKLRTISVPEGSTASYSEHDTLGFPVGTIISKTFYYDTRDVPLDHSAARRPALFEQAQLSSRHADHIRLLETRLLVHDESGWQALPYVWNDNQTDAVLSVTGALKTIGDNIYVVPSRDECSSCHAVGQDKVIKPIGPKARHLHRANINSGVDALQSLVDRGWLAPPSDSTSIPANAVWDAAVQPTSLDDDDLDHRARSYLDANCGHCHNPMGSADTSHLYLDYADHTARSMGRCKPPVAAGRGTGGHLYSIVPGQPDESILSFRMRSTDPGQMMPETGRTRVHTEGAALIDEWIRRKSGNCI